jgi:molybdopterin-guanine dinucleotide biosynthesis protein A
MHPMNATGIVLAGGRSSRMGAPKALLPFDGEPLIAHIVRLLDSLFGDVVIVAAAGQDIPSFAAKLVRDEVAYQGPVAGLVYGLKAATRDLAFVTSCDSAFLVPSLIQHLISRATDHDVVVPYWNGRFQPLHAVYRRAVLPLLEGQLARNDLRPVSLFDKVRTCRVDEDEIRSFDPEGLSFFNMNTPEDYASALETWNSRRGGIEECRMKNVESQEFSRSLHSSFDILHSGCAFQQPASPGREETVAGTDVVECTVELFGVARLITGVRELPLTVPAPATCSAVFAALADAAPSLVGRVIDPGRGHLVDGYACNVNGVAFVRSADAAVASGDRGLILSADAGG